MSPAVAAGDVPSPPGGPAADGGPVVAFGDQIRQLLGAWALAPAEEGQGAEAAAPAATRVNAAPRSPQASRTDEADDPESSAPLPTASGADAVSALWLDPTVRQVPVPRAVPDAKDASSVGAPATRSQGHQVAADPRPAVQVESLGATGVPGAFAMAPGAGDAEEDGLAALPAPAGPRQADAIPEAGAAPHATGRALPPLVIERPASSVPDRTAHEPAPPAMQEIPRADGGQGVARARVPRATEPSLSGLDARRHPMTGQSARVTDAQPVAGPGAADPVVPEAARVVDAARADTAAVTAAGRAGASERPGAQARAGVKPTTAAHGFHRPASADAGGAANGPTASRPPDAWAASPTGGAPSIHGHVESAPRWSATDPGPATPAHAAVPHVAQVDGPFRQTQVPPTIADVLPSEGSQAAAEAELPDQIVQSLRLQITGGGGEARVQLRPEYLGELSIRVVVDDGVVTARLEAEVPAVREWIERHEVSLRQALGEHGLALDELSVSDRGGSDEVLDGHEQEEASDRERPQHHRRARRRADDDRPRFEVTV